MAFKIKEIRPLFTNVIVSSLTYSVTQYARDNGLILDTTRMEGSVIPFQFVKAVGSMVRDIKEGDLVRVNFRRYYLPVHAPGAIDESENVQTDVLGMKCDVPSVWIDGKKYFMVQNNDIEFVVTSYDIDEGGVPQ